MTAVQLRKMLVDTGKKKTGNKAALVQRLLDSFDDVAPWVDFDLNSYAGRVTDLQFRVDAMYHCFVLLTAARQCELLEKYRHEMGSRSEEKIWEEILSNSRKRCDAWSFWINKTTLVAPKKRGSSVFEVAPNLVGEENDQLSVAGRLFHDLSNHDGNDVFVAQFSKHVMKHLFNSWMYHLFPVRNSCCAKCAAAGVAVGLPASQFLHFTFHFLHGISHWNQEHGNCVKNNAHNNAQHGQYPQGSTHIARQDNATKLWNAMARAARQYAVGRSFVIAGVSRPAYRTSPTSLPFDATYDNNTIALPLDYAHFQAANIFP